MMKALILAGALTASAFPASAGSAWHDYDRGERSTHRTQQAHRAQQAHRTPVSVEGPLVNGSVVPEDIRPADVARTYVPEYDQPVVVEQPQLAGFVEPYGGYGSGYGGYSGQTINRTTTSVVLSNGSVVTNERTSAGGPVPYNTYGIDGLIPQNQGLSNGYYADRGNYGGYRGYRNRGGFTNGPVILSPGIGTIVNIDD